jgi:bifunctional DNase/RNase
MAARIKLELISIVPAHSHGAYTLILRETDGMRSLPVLIGAYEAQAIAMELEGIKPSRPLTHDLYINTLKAFRIDVLEVEITDLQEGIFFSCLHCEMDGLKQVIDSRTSDAIAIAVKFHCPIYCNPAVLDDAGYDTSEELETDDEKPGRVVHEELIPVSKSHAGLDGKSTEELETMLDEAIRDEDYAKAAMLRDEISKRKK